MSIINFLPNMSNKSSEPIQLELPEAKKDPTLESAIEMGNRISGIINKIAKTLMQPAERQKKISEEMAGIKAKETFRAFLGEAQNSTPKDWINFIIKDIQTRDVEIHGGALVGLRKYLENFQRMFGLESLLEARTRFQFILENYQRGLLPLKKEAVEKVKEVNFDLNPKHL